MKIKTCGRETSCDLVLEQSTVSRLHARIELADDGLVCIQDAGSHNGTFLNRNDTWIRVMRASQLCIGDRIRFGDYAKYHWSVSLPFLAVTAMPGLKPGIFHCGRGILGLVCVQI